MSRKRIAIFESLEFRQLFAAAYPTAHEQYMVELINRARANPTAEASRYTGYNDGQGHTYNGDLNEGLSPGTISTAAKQPLAINPYLTSAARLHSQWMVDNDTFSHTGSGGSDPFQRMSSAGYSYNTAGENIAVNFNTAQLNVTTTVYEQQRNLFTDQSIAGRGHRTNMMNGSYKEIGAGIASGPWTLSGTNYNSQDVTTDFAANSSVYLTGVAYADTTSADSFYTPGEGIANITVKATRISDGQIFTTTTWTSGGYSLALSAGTYNIQASGGTLPSTIYYNSIAIGSSNVKKDFVSGQSSDPNPNGAPNFAKITSRTLVVTGTSSADTILVAKSGSNYIATMNGESMSFAASLLDVIAVKGGLGNDKITNQTTAPSYLEGSDGKDSLYGGSGNDSLYGDGSNDYIDGGDGVDQLVGSGGADLIKGGNGNDKIYSGAGNDNVDSGAGSDRVYAGDGNDTIVGGAGNDILYGDLGSDVINGGANTDTSDTDSLDTRVSIEILQ